MQTWAQLTSGYTERSKVVRVLKLELDKEPRILPGRYQDIKKKKKRQIKEVTDFLHAPVTHDLFQVYFNHLYVEKPWILVET